MYIYTYQPTAGIAQHHLEAGTLLHDMSYKHESPRSHMNMGWFGTAKFYPGRLTEGSER